MIAFTREPSGRRASTIGELSSIRRPTPLTIRSITRSRCLSSWNVVRQPLELAGPLDVNRLVGVDQDVADSSGPRSSGSSGPSPKTSSMTSLQDDLALGHASSACLLRQMRSNSSVRISASAREPLRRRERLEVQPVEKLAVDVRLQLEVLRPRRFHDSLARGGGRRVLWMWISTSGMAWFRVRIPRNACDVFPAPRLASSCMPRRWRVKVPNCVDISELFAHSERHPGVQRGRHRPVVTRELV